MKTPDPGLPRSVSPVVPVIGQRGVFIPQKDGFVVVALHGEHVRAQVEEVISNDIVVVKLTGIVIGKSGHGYKTGGILPVKRDVEPGLGIEQWTPISEGETKQRESALRLAKAEAKSRAASE